MKRTIITSALLLLLGSPLLAQQDYYEVDNSLLVGTWYDTDGASITFEADGTTDYMNDVTYRFLPWQGSLTIYTCDGRIKQMLQVTQASDNNLVINEYNGTTFTVFHKYLPMEAINLFLPSGTLWASNNLGAHFKNDIGDYYTWDEAAAAITAMCGSEWRLPTSAEVQELIDETNGYYTEEDGVNICRVRTMTTPLTLDLPATGYKRDETLQDPGSGYFWVSDDDSSQAYILKFDSDGNLTKESTAKTDKLVIRPVKK